MKPGVRRLIEDLRGARVLVIHPRDAESEALIDQLRRIGCNVRGVWPPPATIPHDIDTVFQIVETSEDTIVPTSSNEHPLTLVAIVDYENPTILKRLLDSNAHGVVNKPIRSFGILSSLVLARSLRGYTRRLEGKVQKLEETAVFPDDAAHEERGLLHERLSQRFIEAEHRGVGSDAFVVSSQRREFASGHRAREKK